MGRFIKWLRSFWRRNPPPAPVLSKPAAIEEAPPPLPAIEKGKRRQTSKLANELGDKVDDILSRFQALDIASVQAGSKARDCADDLGYLMGCDFHFVDELADRVADQQNVFLLPQKPGEIVEVCWPVDYACIVRKADGYLISRVFTVSPKDVRGRTKKVVPKMVRIAYGFLSDDDGWWAESNICGLMAGKWECLDTGQIGSSYSLGGEVVRDTITNSKFREERENTITLSLSGALTERYSWHVAFGSEKNGPRVVLPTSPRGCLDLFKTRKLREGESRRSALRHWVDQHYRQASDTLAFVRSHLRGVNRFRWKDTDCELLVSAFDLERNEFFKTQAAQWRANRKHNVVRVRLKRRA